MANQKEAVGSSGFKMKTASDSNRNSNSNGFQSIPIEFMLSFGQY
jgi:hypothetical protein